SPSPRSSGLQLSTGQHAKLPYAASEHRSPSRSRIIGLILSRALSPPDSARMGHLCGPMDSHIRSIEAALNVKVAHRFEQFRIEGTKPKANQALEVLQALYEMAKKPIPAEQVQLMLSGDTALPGGEDAIAMQTRRGE